MSIHRHSKEKYGENNCHSRFDPAEDSAARTRPFSFEEIMLRRKNKGLTESVECGEAELGNTPKEVRVENVPDHYTAEGGYIRDKNSSLDLENLVIKGSRKDDLGRKEDHYSRNDETVITRRDRKGESHPSPTVLKSKLMKNTKEKDRGKSDQVTYELRKNEKRTRDDSANRADKKRRDRTHSDRHGDRNREKYADNKRKIRNEEENKKRHEDDGKRREPLKHHFEESRLNERQSRSRDDQNKSRRLASVSPKGHKHSYKHKVLFLNSHEDKSEQRRSDVDRNRISTNGSSSYRRHSGSTSGLGGYSPRKRRVDNSIKTPPPSHRSPDKKSAKWDLPPIGKDCMSSGSVLSFPQSVNNALSSDISNINIVAPPPSTSTKSIMTVSTSPSAMKGNASVDLIQLTQATRPMRRLYIENVPSTATEKALMECLNNFLLSLGVNQIAETQPCISCNLHKEKSLALVEFLTPEDASAALSFDGSCFADSILKIRRPKDFFELATGEPEKSVAVDTISEVVEDSPNKIFIGGISKELSPKMLREIITAFGALKSYHFVINEHLSQPTAFLEYADHSITLKACAGLNGMKVGGQVLTVVQACPYASSLECTSYAPCYDIPEHSKPLLEPPTSVLKLKNVFDPAQLSTLTELQMEEVLEDIRLECARFGVVKSVNYVKFNRTRVITKGDTDTINNAETNASEQNVEQTTSVGDAEYLANAKEREELEGETNQSDCTHKAEQSNDLVTDKSYGANHVSNDTTPEDRGCENDSTENISESLDREVTEIIQREGRCSENKLLHREDLITETEADTTEEEVRECEEDKVELEEVFEKGSIFVEYNRTESSCMAAHCLHGRVFDGRIVTVEYVSRDRYLLRFPK